jgi:hypothetical protein
MPEFGPSRVAPTGVRPMHNGRPRVVCRRSTSPTSSTVPFLVRRRAIGTLAAWVTDGLAHPGVIALPLKGGPQARTCLVWRFDDDRPAIRALVDLASASTRVGRDAG